jgi:hypothetical protein
MRGAGVVWVWRVEGNLAEETTVSQEKGLGKVAVRTFVRYNGV